eukprot:CAMPEP_0194480282 /NCGR_PEP_ID=MMETSP0253-20130528/3136_1 /TAXON_ID=2966 /ORGANISM="Noctiluca scintillans" /LENGTH=136 /DNA_ID=CAMNT_0039319641 /DNA_START=59 /DNA_END=469 /DNA_ORIENTATION=+
MKHASEIGLDTMYTIFAIAAVVALVMKCLLGKGAPCWNMSIYRVFGYVALVGQIALVLVFCNDLWIDYQGGNSRVLYHARSFMILIALAGGSCLGLGCGVWCTYFFGQGPVGRRVWCCCIPTTRCEEDEDEEKAAE